MTHSCLAVDRRAQDRARHIQFSRGGARASRSVICAGIRAFDVLVAWMVAEGYLGQLEASSTNNRRLDELQLETDSTSSTGSDEMMQGAGTDPLSSPEVANNIVTTIAAFANILTIVFHRNVNCFS